MKCFRFFSIVSCSFLVSTVLHAQAPSPGLEIESRIVQVELDALVDVYGDVFRDMQSVRTGRLHLEVGSTGENDEAREREVRQLDRHSRLLEERLNELREEMQARVQRLEELRREHQRQMEAMRRHEREQMEMERHREMEARERMREMERDRMEQDRFREEMRNRQRREVEVREFSTERDADVEVREDDRERRDR